MCPSVSIEPVADSERFEPRKLEVRSSTGRVDPEKPKSTAGSNESA